MIDHTKGMVLSQKQIENRIFTIRDCQVMIDRDLAEMYQVETKVLNQAVKRNLERFPAAFRLQLNNTEKKELVTNCDRFDSMKHSSNNPYAFTEQGVAMLSAVLRSNVAVQISVKIMNAFIQMRKLIAHHDGLLQRMDGLERKLVTADQKFEQVFKALEDKSNISSQGIFFNGQVFDAYELNSKIIRSAKKKIILIDNYIDESSLIQLAKKKKGVDVHLLTKTISRQLKLDVQKANDQYGHFKVKTFGLSHDRFLIIDNEHVYHLGASLKDVGKKWFAFSKMNSGSIEQLIHLVTKEI